MDMHMRKPVYRIGFARQIAESLTIAAIVACFAPPSLVHAQSWTFSPARVTMPLSVCASNWISAPPIRAN